MAGLIKRDTIDAVRQATDLKAVVEDYVTLKSAGVGSFKGLCPFHDERTPSFHVRPSVGTYHCFGCEASGDVFSFLMELEHTSFTETVEALAAKAGIEVAYQDGQGPDRREVGQRQRLLEAHKIADEFYQKTLQTSQATLGQQFLQSREFTAEDAQRFGVGYAPAGWSNLLDHLHRHGFTDQELKATGLFSEGRRGLYDRFRDRLTWPIRDLTGATIGFGARKMSDEDPGPKYLNTPETALYKKSQVLYGLDIAKRQISQHRQLVVVEGYTDVMAAHLAGVDTAVATCGTAFGSGHTKIVRRLISDDRSGAEVIFTFDGDEAGQKAALRAFEEDQQFQARTFVAVEPSGMDPCDLRVNKGDHALRELIDSKRPLFEFALNTTLKRFDLQSVEGRSQALRATAPILAGIKDPIMKKEYARDLAGKLGLELTDVDQAVRTEERRLQQHQKEHSARVSQPGQQRQVGENLPVASHPDLRDPVARMEKGALEVLLQYPEVLSQEQWEAFYSSVFRVPVFAAIQAAIITTGSTTESLNGWVEKVSGEVPAALRPMVAELAVTALPATNEHDVVLYCRDIMNSLFELQITRRKADLLAQLNRVGDNDDEFLKINQELMQLEQRRRAIRGH
ncbi:DNA primase [Auritidibacter ignavus]|uniref:DNA primase n=1 Tax=Auritidibacter TaxID=1160973 RepID=UPI000D72AE09|nr:MULTISPECIES: DNA primase [Auritidibacter]AXR73857.1 DNA primase [Auritidibacter sp. NML130574]PXA78895.1 DNA primase [Auritidibacter sp. NML120636]PXA80070.1 DNA primase [Auritidibacter sp. NML120779]WGH82555.1 DNA primase [Auritidibacter ignavus]